MRLFITIIALFSVNYILSQQIENKIIKAVKYLEKKNGSIEFTLNENFVYKYVPSKHRKEHVSFDSIKASVITFNQLNKNISIKKVNNNYIKLYKGKEYKLWFYIHNHKCKRKGVLYEVDRLIPIRTEFN
ncbi:hypothetical protein ACQY1Q_17285 [Tenacibaculum sp. TC6]|uniref:hypothetical protein n=1 Tax=Tenacibaculum sp. TC6 TaxID=3423223 RepID=UPI003D365B96